MKTAIIALFGRIFRRLVRLSMAHGVCVQEAILLLKTAYIVEAKNELTRLQVNPNVSKVSAMTGLNRREVQKLFNSTEDTQISESNSLMSRIIGLWLGGRRYRASNGQPKVLPIDAAGSSFVGLVQEISQDLNPYTVLFELERLKLIQKEGNSVILKKDGFEPSGDFDRGMALLASDLEHLISSVEKNIASGDSPANLHITTTYDNIEAAASNEIKEWVLSQGASLHKNLRLFLSKYDRDLNPKLPRSGKTIKVVVGSFSNSEELN